MKSKAKIFFSYAREDQGAVEPVYELLRKKGFLPWMDVRDIAPGEEWELSIKRAIRRSNVFLAFVSSHSVSKTGVLQEEIRSAVEIRRENLEGETYLIPVRLDSTPLPEILGPYQQIDYFQKDGPRRLLKALGYRAAWARYFAAAAAVLILAAVAWTFWRPSPFDQFRAARAALDSESQSNAPAVIGLTVWNLRPSEPADRPSARVIVHPEDSSGDTYFTPVRVSPDLELPTSARFRIGVESSRAGYLYVIDQEQFGENGLGPPLLVFPTTRIRGGDNRIAPGELIEMPPSDLRTPYWELRSTNRDYRGELLTVAITPEPIPGLTISDRPLVLDGGTVKRWQASWAFPVRRFFTDAAGALPGDAELQARNVIGRRLSRHDPLPGTLFVMNAKPAAPFLIQASIKVMK
jgi:hypothetical protein